MVLLLKQFKNKIPILIKTFKFYLLISLLFLFILIFLILIRIIKPLIIVRFGCFRQSRIGHFIYDIEYYLCEKKSKKNQNKTLDLFYLRNDNYGKKPCNFFLLKIIKRKININPLIEYFYKINKIFPDYKKHEIKSLQDQIGISMDIYGLLSKFETNIKINNEENKKGLKFLNSLGMLPNEKFICLVVRDSAYLKNEYSSVDWTYQNFRDADIATYRKTCEYLISKGYWVFRMGKHVNDKFDLNNNKFIDYANSNFRSDFLDIWLMANCYFCISTNTGFDQVAKIFKKPIISTNFIPIGDIYIDSFTLTAPKKLIWEKNHKKLNMLEIFEHNYAFGKKYYENGIKILDLNEDEILYVTQEMEKILDNNISLPQNYKKKLDNFLFFFTKKLYKDFKGIIINKKAYISNYYLLTIENNDIQK